MSTFFSSCQYKSFNEKEAYMDEVYEEQKSAQNLSPHLSPTNEWGEDQFQVSLKEKVSNPDWEKKIYEQNEQWLHRIESYLKDNKMLLAMAQEELSKKTEEKEDYRKKLQVLVKQNSSLKYKQEISSSDNKGVAGKHRIIMDAPFTIHLVKPGETLYSIAMNYYGSKDFVENIVAWNQNWIRSEEKIMAGLGIILFFKDSEERDVQTVQDYVKASRNQK